MDFYFIYRHIRVDNGETFYVGCGKRPPIIKVRGYRTKYSRAFAIAKRSVQWKDVYKKTGFTVEILFETNDKDIAYAKEAEYIRLYGRQHTGEGTLVNLSTAQGAGYIRKYDVRVTQMDMNRNVIKIWEQPKNIQSELGYLKTNIVAVCRKRALSAYGFLWEYTDDRSFDSKYPSTARTKTQKVNKKGIVLTDNNTGVEKFFRNQQDVANYLSVHKATIHRYLHSNSKNKNYNICYRVSVLATY